MLNESYYKWIFISKLICIWKLYSFMKVVWPRFASRYSFWCQLWDFKSVIILTCNLTFFNAWEYNVMGRGRTYAFHTRLNLDYVEKKELCAYSWLLNWISTMPWSLNPSPIKKSKCWRWYCMTWMIIRSLVTHVTPFFSDLLRP